MSLAGPSSFFFSILWYLPCVVLSFGRCGGDGGLKRLDMRELDAVAQLVALPALRFILRVIALHFGEELRLRRHCSMIRMDMRSAV